MFTAENARQMTEESLKKQLEGVLQAIKERADAGYSYYLPGWGFTLSEPAENELRKRDFKLERDRKTDRIVKISW